VTLYFFISLPLYLLKPLTSTQHNLPHSSSKSVSFLATCEHTTGHSVTKKLLHIRFEHLTKMLQNYPV